MVDDRLPILLVILDGLGDRASPELQGQTPCEAASTPNLDALATVGINGVHVPFGPGRATSSEHAHWALFGFSEVPFPGRAAIEALGVGLNPPVGVPLFHLALRAGIPRNDALYLGARARPNQDSECCATLFGALTGRSRAGIRFDLLPLRTGEAVLCACGARSHEISDSDSLFDHLHPWMRPIALTDAVDRAAAQELANALEHWLIESRQILLRHPLNAERRATGLPMLDVAVTKWASLLDPVMQPFESAIGIAGAAVTDTALYRGLARVLSMKFVDIPYDPNDVAQDMRQRIEVATRLLESNAFVHVHVKATDEAGHLKQPLFKRDVIAATDAGLSALPALAQRAVVAVTGDHASPSVGGLLHSGDPTPLVVVAPGLRADSVTVFGERAALTGEGGRLRAAEVLPLLLGFANRPFFIGHRPGARSTLALPDAPEPIRHNF